MSRWFFRVFRIPPPIKPPRYSWNIVESGDKHIKPNAIYLTIEIEHATTTVVRCVLDRDELYLVQLYWWSLLVTWVTRQEFYEKQELFIIHNYMRSSQMFLVGSMLLFLLIFRFVLFALFVFVLCPVPNAACVHSWLPLWFFSICHRPMISYGKNIFSANNTDRNSLAEMFLSDFKHT